MTARDEGARPTDAHWAHWPRHLRREMPIPATHLFYNAEVAARRYPDRPYIVFYGASVSFSRFHDEASRIAGFLQHDAGVARGDRVLLFAQNSPQFVIGYYGILRADAIVVPVNPMNRTQELAHLVADSGATVAIVAQELWPQVAPLLAAGALRHVIVATYSDYLDAGADADVPAAFAAPRDVAIDRGVVAWHAALAAARVPLPLRGGPDDLALLVYTSGTTGAPKGCMHTHRAAMHTLVAGLLWLDIQPGEVYLAVAPFFHVTGMQSSMNGPLYTGSTIVLLPRWDRDAAARLIERHRITAWSALPAIFIDFLSNPALDQYDLATIERVTGGGAAMPAAIAQRMAERGIRYVEGYGLSETMAPTHINPPDRHRAQCLGIPIFATDSRIVDPDTLAELPRGEVGEIVTAGPQVFQGYWNQPEATAQAIVHIDGKRFLRTGDLGRIDEDGYFFMVDRLKRMINASGYKVWPAEVESMLYAHPAIQDACVIAARDAQRGETVKALVVLKPDARDTPPQAIIDWARTRMAAYKYPRIVEVIDALPRSPVGKIQWRALQEREDARHAGSETRT